MARHVLTFACAAALVVGAGAGSAAATAGRPAGSAADGTVCERLEQRLAEVPGIRQRIRAQIADLEARIDAIGDPQRRARVETRLQRRIDALERLGARLSQQVALAEQRCASRT